MSNTISFAKMDEYVTLLSTRREELEIKEENLKPLKEEIKGLESKLLNWLEKIDRKNHKLVGIGTITRCERKGFTLPKSPQAEETFFKYVADNHGEKALENLFKLDTTSVKKFCKAEEEASGKPNFKIPGIPDITLSYYAMFTPSNKGGK